MSVHVNNDLNTLLDKIFGEHGIRNALLRLSRDDLDFVQRFGGDVAAQATTNLGCLARTLASADTKDVCPHDFQAIGWVIADLTNLAEVAGFAAHEANYFLHATPEQRREFERLSEPDVA